MDIPNYQQQLEINKEIKSRERKYNHPAENLNVLLPEEQKELSKLFARWRQAHAKKEYALADKCRAEYAEWDSTLGTDGGWFPIFETMEHTKKRAFARMKKYNIDIYPWSREDAR